MAEVIRMPKLSDTMEEGLISSWLVKVGDQVSSGDILAEVETDKATMELENYEDGFILHLAVKEKESVPIDGIIAIVGEKDEDFENLLKENATIKTEKQSEESPSPSQIPDESIQQSTYSSDVDSDRVKISPLAKKLAKEKSYDISLIKGTGENGRIVKRDIENYVPKQIQEKTPVSFEKEAFKDEPISQMRKTIAVRLSESKFTSPHFYLTIEINMDKVIEQRKTINEVSPVKISFNDIIVKATATALRQHPKINASWLGDKIRYYQYIHVGVAVAIEEGLLVPVVRFVDNKSLSTISNEIKDFSIKAKNKELKPADWTGSTFTISNLGMFGIEKFTAIINPPDACILAVGSIKQIPIVKDNEIKIGNVMKVTLSCDHRVVDGTIGSTFLQSLKNLLEDPIRILI